MMNKISFFLLLFFVSHCISLSQNRILAIVDNKESQSLFLGDLKSRGYEVTLKSSRDSSLIVEEFDVYLYDQIIIFTPKVEDLKKLKYTDIVKFIDEGHNVILVGDVISGDLAEDIASELGVSFTESKILDPTETFDVKVSDLKPFIGNSKVSKVSYKGTSLSLSQSKLESGLLFPLLYSSSSSKPKPSTPLVAGFQARNNARVLISGSLSFFSDEFYNTNEEFLREISKWVFQERSVLRVSEVHHSRSNETETPKFYTINETVTFSFKIEELVNEKWVPYIANDVQLEFRMVDPYVRRTLKPTNQGVYALTFVLPDVYGVFTFRVNYRKHGLTHFEIIERTPVRPFLHSQYERFLESATPYYLGSLSMLFGVFIFSFVFLYQKDDVVKKEKRN